MNSECESGAVCVSSAHLKGKTCIYLYLGVFNNGFRPQQEGSEFDLSEVSDSDSFLFLTEEYKQEVEKWFPMFLKAEIFNTQDGTYK